MKTTISARLAAVAFFASATIATQVNTYHDNQCDDYAYTVFTDNWSCQDIAGTEGVILVDSNAKCNFYGDTNCQIFINQDEFSENECLERFNGNGAEFGSIACEG
jgi:hypothetical protein